MYVPFFSKRAPSPGGGGGRPSSSSPKGSSASSKGGTSSGASPIRVPGTTVSASKEKGGGKPAVISPGYPFAGRSVGGGSRNEVYGTRQYGSGYPGYPAAGVKGRGFPFGFWPIVWFAILSIPIYQEIYFVIEYGLPGNVDRPGGPLTIATFTSQASPSINYHLVSDQATAAALISEVYQACSGLVVPSNGDLRAFTGNNQSQPLPEQAIQYYRASSAVLTLDGYNNTAVFKFSSPGVPDAPLPDNNDQELVNCLNNTIRTDILITSSAPSTLILSSMSSRFVLFLIVYLCVQEFGVL